MAAPEDNESKADRLSLTASLTSQFIDSALEAQAELKSKAQAAFALAGQEASERLASIAEAGAFRSMERYTLFVDAVAESSKAVEAIGLHAAEMAGLQSSASHAMMIGELGKTAAMILEDHRPNIIDFGSQLQTMADRIVPPMALSAAPNIDFLQGPLWNVESALGHLDRFATSESMASMVESAIDTNKLAFQFKEVSLSGFDKMKAFTQEATDLISQHTEAQLRFFDEAFLGGLDRFQDIVAPQLKIPNFFDSLPTFPSHLIDFSELDEIDEAFTDAGYHFTLPLWSYGFAAGFAKIHPMARPSSITRHLFAQTKTQRFYDLCQSSFLGSRRLSRRWKLIERGIKAHREKDFLASIPILLPQMEGVVVEAYLMKNAIIRQGRKLFEKNSKGKITVISSRSGKSIRKQVNGLGVLVNQYKHFTTHDELQLCIDLMASHLAPERNAILHGHKTNYATMSQSNRILFAIFIFAFAIFNAEQGKGWDETIIID